MAEQKRAALILVTATGTEPDAIAHGRTWTFPAVQAEAITEELTARFGEPSEMMSTIADGLKGTGIVHFEEGP